MTMITPAFVSADAPDAWLDICALEDIPPDSGVAALVDGRQIALIRCQLGGEALHALDHFDPSSGAMVLARGLVGDRGGVPIIASPITKLAFALQTGCCLDRPGLAVRVHAVRLRAGRIELQAAPERPH